MLLDAQFIQQHLLRYGKLTMPVVEVLGCIDSTNDYLKRALFADPDSWPRACLAEQQTQAKASKVGRNWHSPIGQNLTFSCAISLTKSIANLSGLSLMMGLAVIKGLLNYAALSAQPIEGENAAILATHLKIKWPNDIYWQDKKLAGILTEINAENAHLSHVIIGIGLNVNMMEVPVGSVSQDWTSLRLIYGCPQDRNKLAVHLLEQIFSDLVLFQTHEFGYFLLEWGEYDYLLGKPLKLQVAQGGLYAGIASGVNVYGQLLLRDADGNVSVHASGDIIKS